MKTSRTLAIAAIVGVSALSTVVVARQWGHPIRPSSSNPIEMTALPLKLPAVGNLESVQRWHFGRIERADRQTGPDIILHIRTADGVVHQIVAPREPLRTLARQSNWVTTETQSVVGRADYVERMIAFDADETDRLIALISMEPMNRSRSRLRRALTR